MAQDRRTAAPSAWVTGIREPVPASGNAADAALRHLADRQSRYRIAHPDRDLKPLQTVVAAGGSETVRLQQKHRGVDVLGGQYVVRMDARGAKSGGTRFVTGTSGRYFTGLTVPTEPGIDTPLAIELAVDAVTRQLGPVRPSRDDPSDGREDPGGGEAGQPITGTAHGLVVLPRGTGVLTHHVTVHGTDPATGSPVLREVYIEAQTGYPVLQYSGIKTFRTPIRSAVPGAGSKAVEAGSKAVGSAAPERHATDHRGTDRRGTAAVRDGGTKGSGVRLDGTKVELHLTRDEERNAYVMRDRSRARSGDGGGGGGGSDDANLVATWDARGRSYGEVWRTWPADLREFSSPTADFGDEATGIGAVDAHWAAGRVHDYFKDVHGRNGPDGRGTAVNSLVGLGISYADAFWDGRKVIYGSGNDEYRPFSAALDVVGRELTHGVVESTANLVPAGQSGALGEAVADYFGNAVETDARGIAMDSPDAGLLGETLCRQKVPRACAARDLNDGRTTSKSFVGVGIGTDNGGIHLNSTIFSGALWDIREDIDRTLADRIVHNALTQYMSPLDGFTEGRAAVLAAARDLKVTDREYKAVERAFNAHGIVPGWELALGVDSDRLLGRVNTDDRTSAGAGGGWWTASTSDEDGSEPYSVRAGRLDGTGETKLISPNDGRYHVDPVTDGKTVVWQARRGRAAEILARPLAGGPVKKLFSSALAVTSLHVEGKVVTFQVHRRHAGSRVVYLRMGETAPTYVNPGSTGRSASTGDPSLSHGRIAFTTWHRADDGALRHDTEVLDVATGTRTVMQQIGTPSYLMGTAITGKHVFWLTVADDDHTTTAVRRSDLDGTGTVDISPGTGKDALHGTGLTASDEAVTVSVRAPDPQAPGPRAQDPQLRYEALDRLWQLSPDGSRRERVSCNRGEQLSHASADGRQVIWVDATTGYSDLVTRTRPAGTCG
ncbi:M4 family peptidase [Streptomyces rectiverticillatus]|uniref:M4 family metallopeptidase n=1 Tax=Streptomyces rectiverticillatus TaxID=173860 RepID=UPI0015C3A13B|nr:M4 family metallopeptidase [Streptomyces rectiverticillatus]QLE75694.1 M4 family peptidase [Streptomyces rectiverticillatus]